MVVASGPCSHPDHQVLTLAPWLLPGDLHRGWECRECWETTQHRHGLELWSWKRLKSSSEERRWYERLISSPCRLLWLGRCWQYCSKKGYKSLWLGSLKNCISRYFDLLYVNWGPLQRGGRKSPLHSGEIGGWRSKLCFCCVLWFLVSFHFQLHWLDTCSGFLQHTCGILWSCLLRPRPKHVISSATKFFLSYVFSFLKQIFFFFMFFTWTVVCSELTLAIDFT